MLVLSRKRGEEIVIGNGITVTVLEVQGNRVRLGFNAPVEVPIHRKEIHAKLGAEMPAPALQYADCA
jgi:carbon storage regulator